MVIDSKAQHHIISGHGLTATFIPLGATLCDLRLNGHHAPLVLGLQNYAHYRKHNDYMGGTVGRFANRIANARFNLADTCYHLDANFLDKHTLHGGVNGSDKLIWHVDSLSSSRIIFSTTMPDGHMGFPGNLHVTAAFECTKNATLKVEYTATCDAPTLCNFAHHSYFILDDSGDIRHHLLKVNAKNYTPVNEELIPTGCEKVSGTAFDFQSFKSLPLAQYLDHNFCLSNERVELREVAELKSTLSGVKLQVSTTEPGLQIYDGSHLQPLFEGIDGRQYHSHAGVAIEPQGWPDSPNKSTYPSAFLFPHEQYKHISCFSFSKT